MSRHLQLSKIVRYLDYSRLSIRFQNSSRRYLVRSFASIRVDETLQKIPKTLILRKELTKKEIVIETGDTGDKRLVRRFLQIFLVLIRVVLITSIASLLITLYYISPKMYSASLLRAMEFLGSTFVKLGQWASTRRDLFSEDICDVLSHLQRQSSTHSWMYTKCLMSATFGPEWENLFRRIERKPIGSGCCAQVYRAWVRSEKMQLYRASDNSHLPGYVHVLELLGIGLVVDLINSYFTTTEEVPEKLEVEELIPVVIKVVHPRVENYVETDLFMIELFSVLISHLVPSLRWLDLPGCTKEFASMMRNQLDMKLEAHNLQRFSSNFSKNHAVIFPTPLNNLTTRNILVESYHEGEHISGYLKSSDHAELKKQLVKIAIPLVMKMVFEDNFFHCDLHPGNILVQERFHQQILPFCSSRGPRLVILDCGLVSSLNDRCLQNLRDVLHSIVTGDGALAGDYIMRHSSHMTPDPNGFKTSIENIMKRHMTNKMGLKNVNLTAVMKEFYSALIHYKVQQDSAFINVVLSVLLIEGLGRNLDVKDDILQDIIPYLR